MKKVLSFLVFAGLFLLCAAKAQAVDISSFSYLSGYVNANKASATPVDIRLTGDINFTSSLPTPISAVFNLNGNGKTLNGQGSYAGFSLVSGGILNIATCTLTITSMNCGSTSFGGAFYLNSASKLNINNSNVIFSSNTSSNYGGVAGLFFNSEFNINNSTVTFLGNGSYTGSGGALFYHNGVMGVTGSNITFSQNKGNLGGAIYCGYYSTINLSGKLTFTNNVAVSSGGAIYLTDNSSMTLTASTGEMLFASNTANGKSNDIYIDGVGNFLNFNALNYDIKLLGGIVGTSTTNIINKTGAKTLYIGGINDLRSAFNVMVGTVTIENAQYNSGVINMSKDTALNVNNSVFTSSNITGNTAILNGNGENNVTINFNASSAVFSNLNNTLTYGGAVYLKFSKFNINNSNIIFSSNSAVGSRGGAVDIEYSELNVNNSNVTFSSNTSSSWGGALTVTYDSKFNIDGSAVVFSNNKNNSYGGALEVNSNSQLNITNSTVIFSSNTGSYGGAIDVYGSVMNAAGSNIIFLSNTSGSGAMFVNNSTINLSSSNVVFSSNSATSGGAIYGSVSSNINLLSGKLTFTNNVATSFGGAVYLSTSSKLNITGSTAAFSGNSAVYGGAVFMSSFSALNISSSNVVFSSNTSTNGLGGAIYADKFSAFNINNSSVVFSNNASSSKGGAVYLSASEFNINNSNLTFSSNTSLSEGGAVEVEIGSKFNISNSTVMFLNNRNSSYGGAMEIQNSGSQLNITNSTVIFSSNTGNSGGAVDVYGSAVMNSTGSNIIFSGNSAVSGGAIYNYNSTINLSGKLTFTNNTATNHGGAIYLFGSSSTLTASTGEILFASNTAGGVSNDIYIDGGGQFLNFNALNYDIKLLGGILGADTTNTINKTGDKTLYISGINDLRSAFNVRAGTVTIENAQYNSGVINLSADTALNVNNSVFTSSNITGTVSILNVDAAGVEINFNASSAVFSNIGKTLGHGGVVYLPDSSKFNINNSNIIFSSNSASSGMGSVVYTDSLSEFNINDSNVVFSSNTSSSWGGAIDLNSGSKFSISDSIVTFLGNTGVNGGAVDVYGSTMNVADSNITFSHNKATSGGAIYGATFSNINLSGKLTFTSNTATSNGGAVYLTGSTMTLTADTGEILFRGNKDSTGNNDVYLNANAFLNLDAKNYGITMEGGIRTTYSVNTNTINKTGSETWYLGGNNDISGNINIIEGKLKLMSGAVFNASTATVKIGANAEFESSGASSVSMNNLDWYGKVMLSGNAGGIIQASTVTIHDGATVGMSISAKRVKGSQTGTILNYSNSEQGFEYLKADSTLLRKIKITDTGSSLVFDVENLNHSDLSLDSENSKQIAGVMDALYSGYYDANNSFYQNIISKMESFKTLQEYEKAADQLSGSFIANVLSVPSVNVGKSLLFKKINSGDKGTKIWAQGFGGSFGYNADNQGGDFESSAFGMQAGANLYGSEKAIAGAMLSYSAETAKQSENSADISDIGFGGYMGYFAGNMEFRGSLRFGLQSYETERNLTMFNQKTKGEFSGYGVALNVEAAYKMGIIKPFAALGFGMNTNDSFKETGGDAVLDVESGSYTRADAEIGVGIEKQSEKSRLYADLGLGALLAGSKGEFKAKFEGKDITTEGIDQGSISVRLGAGGEINITQAVGIYANLGYKFTSGYNDVYGNLGVSFKIGK